MDTDSTGKSRKRKAERRRDLTTDGTDNTDKTGNGAQELSVKSGVKKFYWIAGPTADSLGPHEKK